MGGRREWWFVVAWLAAAWTLVTVVFVGFLVLENQLRTAEANEMVASCEIYDSTYGHGVWQWWPPGTRCEIGSRSDVPVPTPRVFSRPGAWRAVFVIVLFGALVALAIVASVRRPRPRMR